MANVSNAFLKNDFIEKLSKRFPENNSPGSFPPLLQVALNGSIVHYNSEAQDFINLHLQVNPAAQKTIFHLMPLEALEDFSLYFLQELNFIPQKKEFYFSFGKKIITVQLTRLSPLNEENEKIQIRFGLKNSKPTLDKAVSMESQARLKNILSQSLDIICIIDGQGILKEVSAASQIILGYTPKEMIGTKFFLYVSPRDSAHTRSTGAEVRKGKAITNFSNRLLHKEGNPVPLIWSLRWDAGDKLMYCVGKDATEIKKAHKKILQERAMLKAIIDNIPDYIYALDQNHKAILTNKRFYAEYLGKQSEQETLELSPEKFFLAQESDEIMRDNTRILESGRPVLNRKEVVYDHKKKKEVILLTKVPFSIKTGVVSGLVCIARNITDAHNLEKEQKFIFQLINSIGKASNVKSALAEMIALISEFMDFDEAEAWEVGYAKTSLIKSASYKKSAGRPGISSTKTFKKGVGLPGITWESSKVQVWNNLENKDMFLRKTGLKRSKFDLGIGVPIIYKTRVVAVLSFFGNSRNHDQRNIKEILERIAFQISTGVRRRMSENRLTNMFKHSPYLIAVIGLDGYLKKVNPAFSRIFGYTEQELLDIPFSNFLHEEEKNIITKRLREVVGGNPPKAFQNRCLTKAGEWKWISWTPSELLEEEGIVHLFGIDITRIKSTNLELIKYKNIVESSKDGIGLYDIETGDAFLNSAFKEVLGSSTNTLNGLKKLKEFYPDKDLAYTVISALSRGEYWEGDIRIINNTGELLNYHLSAGPILNKNGEFIAVFGIHTDISQRLAQEEALMSFGNRINNILNSITDCFFSLSPTGEVTYWNNAAEHLLNIPREEIISKNIWEFFPNAKSTLYYEKYKEALSCGHKVSFEEFHPPLEIWLDINIYPGMDGISVYFKDITHRKNVEKEIKLAKDRYDLVARATREAVYDWDILNGLLEWNESYFNFYAYKKMAPSKMLEQWINSIHIEDRPGVVKKMELALQSSQSQWECEYRLVYKENQIAVVLERGFIIRDEKGGAVRMIGSLNDVTRLKQNEHALEKLNSTLQKHADELATSNAELEQFAYIASHDLQEPLRMVTSFLSQLQKKYDSQLDERARQYIHFATDGAVRMRQILLDLLEYSRAGRLDYHLQEIDLNKMMEEIMQFHSNSIKEKGAVIHYKNLPKIKGALTPLHRVLSNLISNGIKYSQKNVSPKITVEATENVSHWEMKVIDNGIGINEQFFEKIFVIFQRLHSRDEYSGTGIGLAICKKIIENHGGKIWVSSFEGKGSTFHFTINKQF